MLRVWKYGTYEVREMSFDRDLHQFEVVTLPDTPFEELAHTITPDSLEIQEEIVKDLNNGNGVNGWEDGNGDTIRI